MEQFLGLTVHTWWNISGLLNIVCAPLVIVLTWQYLDTKEWIKSIFTMVLGTGILFVSATWPISTSLPVTSELYLQGIPMALMTITWKFTLFVVLIKFLIHRRQTIYTNEYCDNIKKSCK